MINKKLFWKIGLIILLLFSSHGYAEQANKSQAFDEIKKRGMIRVGVKTDFSPYNSINSKREIVGFESDLAEIVASKLGVGLQKVSITTENRFQKLELGDVDILIATVGDTAARRLIATAVEPGYNETSVNVLFRPNQAVNTWEQIRGKTVCAVQGSYFNKPMGERYLLQLQNYKTVRDAHLALKDGQCSGFLYATPALANTLKLPEWTGYSMSLPQALITPLAIFISRNERGSELDILLGNILADLHRTGWLIDANKKWQIITTEWLQKQNAIWTERNASGQYTCIRNASGLWSAACRSAEYVSSSEVDGIQAIGLWVKEQLGVDLNFIYDPYDRTQFFQGVLYTMLLIASSIVISLALGIFMSIIVDNKKTVLTHCINIVMAYGRLTPPLLMMYLIFFGFGGWSMREYGVKISAFAVAALCLGYYTAGLVMSAFLEAAKHIRTYRPEFVLSFKNLSQTASYANWPVKQALINLTKQTMIASAIAIPELLSASSLLIAEKGNIFLIMTVLLLTFYAITSLWTQIFNMIETKLLVRVTSHDQ